MSGTKTSTGPESILIETIRDDTQPLKKSVLRPEIQESKHCKWIKVDEAEGPDGRTLRYCAKTIHLSSDSGGFPEDQETYILPAWSINISSDENY